MSTYQQQLQTEAEDKIKELFQLTDHYMPENHKQRFTQYDNLKEEVSEMVKEYWGSAEEHEKLEEEKEKLETWKEEATEVLGEIWSELHPFSGWIDLEEPGGQYDADQWKELMDKLSDLSEGNIPSKRTSKKKRK